MPTDQDIDARVEAELNARVERELAAERARKRAEIAAKMRAEASAAEYARIARRHPIEGPGDPAAEAERKRIMDAGAAVDNAHMDWANAWPRPRLAELIGQLKALIPADWPGEHPAARLIARLSAKKPPAPKPWRPGDGPPPWLRSPSRRPPAMPTRDEEA